MTNDLRLLPVNGININELVTNGVTQYRVLWFERRFGQDGAICCSDPIRYGDGWGTHWVHLSSLRRVEVPA